MGVLQRLQFPPRSDVFGLYFRSPDLTGLENRTTGPRLVLADGMTVSTNTYFNAFFQQHHAAHWGPAEAAWELSLNGSADVRLVRETCNNQREVLLETSYRDAAPDRPCVTPIPAATHGRVYLEITARGDLALDGGRVTTPAAEHPTRLAVLITTFHREAFVRSNVDKLLADSDLKHDLEVYVVDNGGTLTPEMFPDPRVRLAPNPNTGGAGGFSRGMLEALGTGTATHLLIMDDDVEVPAESVFRTLAFFRHARGRVAVSGAMFDLEKPHHLHEAGARWGWAIDVSRPQPLKILPLKHNVYMQSSCGLNALLLDEPADYGAFWFFAFPAEMPREQGLCLPFFVVGDDIEFGLRFTRAFAGRIAPLAGVAVWHVPFYFKLDSLAPYFFHRNLLAVSAVHDAHSPLTVAGRFFFETFKSVCLFDYLRTFKIVRGGEDFLRGPEALPDIPPESVHTQCEEFRTRHGLHTTTAIPDSAPRPFDTEPPATWWREILRWLTLGGHLAPSFLLRRAPALAMTHRCGQWRHTLGHRQVHLLHRELFSCHEATLRRGLGLHLLYRAARVSLGLVRNWRGLSRRWRALAPTYTSPNFWHGRLGRKEP